MEANDRSTQEFTFPDGGTFYVNYLSPEAEQQEPTKRQLKKAGIDLTPDQETQLQQAFSEAIAFTLTPEQQEVWEQYLREETAQRAEQANSGEFPLQRDRAEEARQWEAIKQALTDAGEPMTAEQEAQMQQIDEQMGSKLEQAFRANPMRSLWQLLSVFFLPRPIQWMFGSSKVGNSLITYIKAVKNILTPEQYKVWERYWSDRRDTQDS